MAPTNSLLKIDAKKYLMDHLPGSLSDDVAERVKVIRRRPPVPRDTAEKIGEVALAYALSLYFEGDSALLKALTKEGASWSGRNNLDRALVDAITCVANLEPRRAQQRQSRNVRALRYLQRQKTKPTAVAVLGRKKGEGLKVWADRAAQASSKGASSGSPSNMVQQPYGYVTVEIGHTGWVRHWPLDDMRLAKLCIEEMKHLGKGTKGRPGAG